MCIDLILVLDTDSLCLQCNEQGLQGRWGARGAGRQNAAPPAGTRGAAKFRGR